MTFLLAGLGIVLASGFLAMATRGVRAIGPGGAVVGCALGLAGAIHALATGASERLKLAWGLLVGSFDVTLDPLSAFFLVPILGISALAAVYGAGYLEAWRGRKALGPTWLFFNTLVASMGLAVVASDAILFLLAWETMALSSFFLVLFEHERRDAREAGWTYLVATHLGTAFLIAFFLLLGREAGSFEFSGFASVSPVLAGPLFVLALMRMPITGTTFLIGAAAICGLPPLNGFVSEFLIFLAAYGGAVGLAPAPAAASIAVIAGLAIIGGLAAACFTKAFGVVFLGEPRTAHAEPPQEAPRLIGGGARHGFGVRGHGRQPRGDLRDLRGACAPPRPGRRGPAGGKPLAFRYDSGPDRRSMGRCGAGDPVGGGRPVRRFSGRECADSR